MNMGGCDSGAKIHMTVIELMNMGGCDSGAKIHMVVIEFPGTQ